jgi:hypothetical protein
VDVPGLHVDLAARFGHVEMDHRRQLRFAAAVGDERTLDGVDARRHRQRRADVGLTEDPDGGHARSLPAEVPGGQPRA